MSHSTEHDALVKVQRMIQEGSSVEAVQAFLAQALDPALSSTTRKVSPCNVCFSEGLDETTPSTGKGIFVMRTGQGFALPSIMSGPPVTGTTTTADSSAHSSNGNNNSAPLPESAAHHNTTPPAYPTTPSTTLSAFPTKDSSPNQRGVAPSSPSSVSASSAHLVRPEARRDIGAFIDGSYSRVPLPRRNMNSSTSSTASLSPANRGSHSKLEPLAGSEGARGHSAAQRAVGGAQTAETVSPRLRRDTANCAPRLTMLDTVEVTDGTPNDNGNPATSPNNDGATTSLWPSVTIPNSGIVETPTYRGKAAANNSTSVGTGASGATASSPVQPAKRSARERCFSAADSFAGDSYYELPPTTARNQTSFYLHGATRSFTGGVTGGVARGFNVRRPSALPVTARIDHLNNGSDEGEGNDPHERSGVFFSEWEKGNRTAGELPGPRFARVFARDTDAHVPLEETKRMLADLGVPFLPELHAEPEPAGEGSGTTANRQTGNAAQEVDPVGIANRYGLQFFVYIAMNCFLRYSFVGRFGFDIQKLHNFMKEAFTFFRPGNPLHHPIHASDILIAAHQWVCQPSVAANLADEEILAFLFSAAVMRVGHSGVDNRLLTFMKHPYAMMCSYGSPQQSATVALVMALLERPACRFFPRIFHTKTVHESLNSSTTTTTTTTTQEAAAATNKRAATEATFKGGPDATKPPPPSHSWTQFREFQFFDIVNELVIATDERNHFELMKGIVEIRNDHFRSHGCLCPVKPTTNGDYGCERPYSMLACRTCCCYICDEHLPKVLKAVLHVIDFAYLFRPFEVFVSGTVVSIAENYRQQRCQMRLLAVTEKLQRMITEDEGKTTKATRKATNNAQAAVAATLSALNATDQLAGGATGDGAGSAAAEGAERVEAALAAEQPAWRTDALHSSTLSFLRTLQTMPARAVEDILRSDASRCISRAGGCGRGSGGSGGEESSRSASVSLSGCGSRRPLQGLGRDIILIALEELHFPFLAELIPYLPRSWSINCRGNYERFLVELPTPEEYDALVEKVLNINAPEAPAEAFTVGNLAQNSVLSTMQPTVADLQNSIPLAKYIAFETISRLIPPLPTWNYDDGGQETRILSEITQAGKLWTNLGATYKTFMENSVTSAAKEGPQNAAAKATAGKTAPGKVKLTSKALAAPTSLSLPKLK